jgi:hypothetical protein
MRTQAIGQQGRHSKIPAATAGRAPRVALVVAVLVLAWPVAAFAVLPANGSSVDAPGLTAGPFVTGAGLVWEGSAGIMLTDRVGKSTVLAPPDTPNWNGFIDLAWFGLDRWAVARSSGVFAGRIGGRLSRLPQLSRCNPATPSATSVGTLTRYAVSGDHLYAALDARCFARRAEPSGAVVDVNLRSRHAHVLVPLPGALGYIAASGKYLALAYWRNAPRPTAKTHREPASPRQLFVRVLNAATGALVNQVTPPASAPDFVRNSASGVQVDKYGDVLVTAGCCAASPGVLAHVAQPLRRSAWWWAKARSRVGQETRLGNTAVLSDGRVAFFSPDAGSRGGQTIEVRKLLDGATSTVVAFSGSMNGVSLALSGNVLAWAQQSVVVHVVRGTAAGGGSFVECNDVPLSPVELATLDLRRIRSSPVVVGGVPIPSQYANEPPCIMA